MKARDVLKVFSEGLLKLDCVNIDYKDSVSLAPNDICVWFINSKTSRTIAFFNRCPKNVPYIDCEAERWNLIYSDTERARLEIFLKGI